MLQELLRTQWLARIKWGFGHTEGSKIPGVTRKYIQIYLPFFPVFLGSSKGRMFFEVIFDKFRTLFVMSSKDANAVTSPLIWAYEYSITLLALSNLHCIQKGLTTFWCTIKLFEQYKFRIACFTTSKFGNVKTSNTMLIAWFIHEKDQDHMSTCFRSYINYHNATFL